MKHSCAWARHAIMGIYVLTSAFGYASDPKTDVEIEMRHQPQAPTDNYNAIPYESKVETLKKRCKQTQNCVLECLGAHAAGAFAGAGLAFFITPMTTDSSSHITNLWATTVPIGAAIGSGIVGIVSIGYGLYIAYTRTREREPLLSTTNIENSTMMYET